jgi:hypothetical protein
MNLKIKPRNQSSTAENPDGRDRKRPRDGRFDAFGVGGESFDEAIGLHDFS